MSFVESPQFSDQPGDPNWLGFCGCVEQLSPAGATVLADAFTEMANASRDDDRTFFTLCALVCRDQAHTKHSGRR